MSIHVPQSVIEETKKCPHDFVCLSTGQCGDPVKCKVSYANGKNVLFLTSTEDISCPYRIRFANGIICACPIYFTLHQRQVSETRKPKA